MTKTILTSQGEIEIEKIKDIVDIERTEEFHSVNGNSRLIIARIKSVGVMHFFVDEETDHIGSSAILFHDLTTLAVKETKAQLEAMIDMAKQSNSGLHLA